MKKQFRRAGALMLALLMLMTAAPALAEDAPSAADGTQIEEIIGEEPAVTEAPTAIPTEIPTEAPTNTPNPTGIPTETPTERRFRPTLPPKPRPPRRTRTCLCRDWRPSAAARSSTRISS